MTKSLLGVHIDRYNGRRGSLGFAASLIIATTLSTGTRVEASTPGLSMPRSCHTMTPRVLHRALPHAFAIKRTTWAIVRVTIDRNGIVQAKHVAWQSGNRAFNRAALAAIPHTAFTPASRSCVAVVSTVDYAMMARPAFDVVTAILPPVVGHSANSR